MIKRHNPPKLLLRFFRWYCHSDYQEDIEGDLRERFERRAKEKGISKAKWGFFKDIMLLFRPGIIRSMKGHERLNHMDMFRNHLRFAVRTALRHKGYAALNLTGLAVGVACFSIILLYLNDELSFDKFHKDSSRIHRIVKDRTNPRVSDSDVPPALMPAVVREIPEVNQGVRLHTPWSKGLLGYEDKVFHDGLYLHVDSTFFDFFSFSFVHGNAQSALASPSSIVLTESLARKYFGDDEALGKTLIFNFGQQASALQVSGIIKDVPSQSHFTFDFLLPMPAWLNNEWWKDTARPYHTYIKLNPKANVNEVDAKIQKLVQVNNPENTDTYSTQPLTGLNGIHLSSHRSSELQPNHNKLYIKVLLIVALFVILIAGINYVNLATARSALRTKEIGVRKVVGAFRKSLILQFLTESVLTSIIAGFLAIGLTEAALPFFNAIMQKQLSLFAPASQPIWWLIAAIVLGVGIFAGLYPALYLSAFKPALVVKNLLVNPRKRFGLRQGLVVFQFGLAALLMVAVIVVQKQLNYIHSANLGFDKDQIIIIENFWQVPERDRGGVIRHSLAQLAGVRKIGAGGELGSIIDGENQPIRAKGTEKEIAITMMDIDRNYLNVFDLKLKEGRNFSSSFPGDSIEDTRIILNETAVKHLGLKDPVGRDVIIGNHKSNIIGVVKDFHFSSLHTAIKPIGLVWEETAKQVAIKMTGGTIQETLSQIENIWTHHVPGVPFDFHFLDTTIERQYQFEQNFRSIFSTMTGLSLVIAGLGLFGLAVFTTQLRTKEIGIRKVHGAKVINIVRLLSTEIMGLVLLANLVAWPIAYYAMKQWLQNFAYRTTMDWWIFVIAGLVALFIALFTVSYHTIKTARANPVNAIKNE